MPEMNGITLAAELHKTRPYLSVILMTGYGKDLGYDTIKISLAVILFTVWMIFVGLFVGTL